MSFRLLCCFALALCVTDAAMLLRSSAFRNFEAIPRTFGCEEMFRDHLMPSPPLEWIRSPVKTQSYVIMVDDIDADGFVHWLVTDITPNITSLSKDASGLDMPAGSKEWSNSYGEPAYGGMCPPPKSTHLYRFRVYARKVPSTVLNIPKDVKLTSALIDDQLMSDEHTLYVAVLAGSYHLDENIPPTEWPPTHVTKTIHSTEPMKVIRYLKPSETIRNKRLHNSPRPYGTFPYNTTRFCERKHSRISESEYAQLCNVTRVPEKVENGGFEEPEQVPTPRFQQSNSLLSKSGMSADYFHTHRIFSNDPWIVTPNGLVPPPSSLKPLNLEQSQPTEVQKEATGVVKNVPTVVLAGSSATENVHDTTVDLIQWECDENKSESLVLRSPLWDSCDSSKQQIAARLPEEFNCDPADTEPQVGVSPPVSWKLAPELSRRVKSFLLVLEEPVTKKTFWVVRDIPASQRSLSLGVSGEISESQMKELGNGFGIQGFKAPCGPSPQNNTSSLRFHIYALSTQSSQQIDDISGNAEKIMVSVRDVVVGHAMLDVIVK